MPSPEFFMLVSSVEADEPDEPVPAAVIKLLRDVTRCLYP